MFVLANALIGIAGMVIQSEFDLYSKLEEAIVGVVVILLSLGLVALDYFIEEKRYRKGIPRSDRIG